MQHSIRESALLPQVAAPERRINAWVLMAALVTSQGCAMISDAPDRAVPTKRALPPESRVDNLSHEEASKHTFPQEAVPKPAVRSPRELEPAAPVVRLPPPAQPTMTETGLASWYGPKFHGKRTASGEIFNQEKFTAAHPSLPWGSRVKVVNLANGKSVEVRINDRGPYGKGRIIDVSRAAARVLGMMGSGITTVRVEWLSDSEKSNDLVLQDK
jgi:rare lipoprotein A